jgi:hypothetical protein
MSNDTSKPERIQQKFAPYFNRFFSQVHYCYSLYLEQLKLHSLRMRRHHFDALLFTEVCLSSKFWPSVLETVGLQIPARYIRGSVLFSVCSSRKIIPLLDELWVLKLLAGMLIYEPKLFFLIVFHNDSSSY